jgi:hypothetical protein
MDMGKYTKSNRIKHTNPYTSLISSSVALITIVAAIWHS